MNIQLSKHFTYKKLLRFILPSIIMMVFTSIYSVVDGSFVSNFVGKSAFASVNLIIPYLMEISSLLKKDYFIPSSLYKKADKYILLVEFPVEMDNSQIITFMITAEEYGAECSNQRLEGYYLSEHAKLIIKEKAVETLFRMN